MDNHTDKQTGKLDHPTRAYRKMAFREHRLVGNLHHTHLSNEELHRSGDSAGLYGCI